jgi:release factor glutamine methyltransferase
MSKATSGANRSMTVRQALSGAHKVLGGQTAGRIEAEILLGKVLDVGRAWLYANPEAELSADQQSSFQSLVQRREAGEPVAYLTGNREFWSLNLKVTPDVLIPRPETELLVETALARIPLDAHWRVADLGTGSGAIALAIASERPLCEVHATDISKEALDVARDNEKQFVAGRIRFHQGSWLEALTGKFKVIVSNPPYIAASDPHLLLGDCRFEPAGALASGSDGLSAILEIVAGARKYLEDGGMLAFEHGFDQGGPVRALLKKFGYQSIETRKDLENRDRVTSGTLD